MCRYGRVHNGFCRPELLLYGDEHETTGEGVSRHLTKPTLTKLGTHIH